MRNWIAITALIACACTGSRKQDAGSQVTVEDLTILPSPADSTLEQGQPLLQTDPGGTVYLSWVERLDTTHHRMQYAVLSDSGWSAAMTIASGSHWFVNWADFPQFAADGKGHFIATYLQKSGPGKFSYDVMVTMSAGGADWRAPVKLNEDGKEAEHGFVSIVPAPEGFLVSWLDGRRTNPMPAGSHDHDAHDGGQMTLRAALLDTAGRKLWERELDDRTCDCCQTSIALGPEGPIVVYRDRSENEIRDILVARMHGGAWQQPVAVHADDWKISGCPVNGPHVEARGDIAAVAWYTEAGGKPAVHLSYSKDAGKTFGTRIRIHDSIPLGRVDLVLNDDQSAFVSWMEGDRILARTCRMDGSTGPVALIGRNTAARAAGFPQMTRFGNRIVFAWTDADSKRIMTTVIPIAALLR